MQTASRKWSPGELLKGASEALSPVYINIATDNDIYCAGDTVSAKVQVDVEKPCVVEQGTISLRYCWGYEYTSDNDTHYHESHSVVAQRSILQGRLLSPGQPVLEEFSGLIPADAQPTVLGLGVQVRWEVNVVVKVPGVDGKASLNLVVLSPQIEPPEPSPQSETGRFESHEIQVKVDRSTVRLGETVEGTVVVIPRTDLKARSIDLSLVYREKVFTGSYWSWSYPVAIDLRLADRPDPLPLGSRKAYPFVVQVPTSAFPSLQTDDFKTYWTLTAKVNRRFRRDEKVELPIHVQTVPAEVPLGEAPGGLA